MTEISAALRNVDAFGLCGIEACLGKQGANRIGHRHVCDEPRTEKRFLTRKCAIDELIDDDEVARRIMLFERTARRDRNEIGNACTLQCINVGTKIDVSGRDAMSTPMTRQKADRQAIDLGEQYFIGYLAPRARDTLPVRMLDPRNIVEPAAANDPQHRLCHSD